MQEIKNDSWKEWHQKHGHMRDLLILNPWNNNKLNIKIQQITPNLHTSTSERSTHWNNRRWENCTNLGGRLGERNKGAVVRSRSSPKEEGEQFPAGYWLFEAQISAASVMSIFRATAPKDRGRELSVEGWQLCLSNHHCQARVWVKESGLASTHQSRACSHPISSSELTTLSPRESVQSVLKHTLQLAPEKRFSDIKARHLKIMGTALQEGE